MPESDQNEVRVGFDLLLGMRLEEYINGIASSFYREKGEGQEKRSLVSVGLDRTRDLERITTEPRGKLSETSGEDFNEK